jgi:glutaminyl-peptide cyclotransferase
MFAANPPLALPLRCLLPLLLIGVGVAGCDRGPSRETVEILGVFSHDPGAYTQGLLLHEGFLFESTGTYGGSSLRKVDPRTGLVVRQVDLDERFFAEGLALVGDRLIQLTWNESTALIYDLETFERVGEFNYPGSGWGLCYDGVSLWMTTGGSMLVKRDPETFTVLDRLPITLGDEPLFAVNELACVGDFIYGNVFQTDTIVRIDKKTGEVVGVIDASPLNPLSGRPNDPEAVLNGIAWNPETETFLLTGKRWPTLFEVRFVPDR